jgi:Protein of unknown function (DUF3429)
MSPSRQKYVSRLGYGGLLPFAGLALLAWLVPPEQTRFFTLALAAYSACIVSFLGGIHWGLGFQMGEAAPRMHFFWGITPPLLAWLALLLPSWVGLLLLAGVLLACYQVDRNSYPATGLARWLPIRLRLTAVAMLACLAGAVRAWSQAGY